MSNRPFGGFLFYSVELHRIKKPPTLEIGAFHIFHNTHYYERHYYSKEKGLITSPRLVQRSSTAWRALLDTRRRECAS